MNVFSVSYKTQSANSICHIEVSRFAHNFAVPVFTVSTVSAHSRQLNLPLIPHNPVTANFTTDSQLNQDLFQPTLPGLFHIAQAAVSNLTDNSTLKF
jgi:hypothetical protein